MSRVKVRYMVSDVDAAIPFYTDMLDFKVVMIRRRASQAWREGIYNYCSTGRVPAALDKLCRLVSLLVQAAGTKYKWSRRHRSHC